MKQFLRIHTALVLFVYLLSISAYAQPTKIPVNPDVKFGKLDNGLTYYIQKNKKPANRVEFRLAVNAGSVQEDNKQIGMAHFVEHMCFNGTENFPKNNLIHYLQAMGANFGPDINGYTSFEETVYMLSVASDSASIVDSTMLIMLDWAHAVTFDPLELEKERGVILEEWRIGRGAGQRMRDKYIPVLLKGSKYAERLPIGTKESIESTPYDDIVRFYKTWYRPELMAFVVVGDIDPDEMEAKIKARFSKIKKSDSPVEKEQYSIEDNKEPLVAIVSDKENTQTVISLSYKSDNIHKIETLDDFLALFERSIFAAMLNDRLEEISKKADAPFLYAYGYYGKLWVRPREAFQVSMYAKQDRIADALTVCLTENERVKRYGFTEAELERNKKKMLSSLENAYLDKDNQESSNLTWQYVYNFLENEPMPGIEFQYKFIKENIDKIKLENINKLAQKWIRNENQVLVLQGIEKEGFALPSEQEIKNILASSSSLVVEPYTENTVNSELFTQNVAPGKVVSTNVKESIGLTEITLSNGLKVLLKPTTFKNNEILMSAYAEGGTSRFSHSYKLASSFTSSVIYESGVSNFNRIELEKALAGKQVNVGPYVSPLYSGFNGSSSVADFETMLQLTNLYFTNPRIDEPAFNTVVTQRKEMYKNALSNPIRYFYNQAQYIMYNHHPETPGVLPVEKDWENLSLEQIREIYSKSFDNAANFTFMFVGSFKNEEIIPLLEKYLGSLPSSAEKSAFVDKNIRPVAGPLNEAVYKGTDPKSYVILSLTAETEWSKRESHGFWSLCQILQRVLTDKLREEMSGVYGFGISGDVTKDPYESYYFQVIIPCGPENAERLVAATLEELERMKTDGPTQDELDKEITTQRRAEEKNLEDNSNWIWRLNRMYQVDKELGRAEKPYELCEMLTIDLMREMAQKYLKTENMVRITLYPEGYEKESK
ncbi:MAG: insulinase family protein [Bacteroidales bacterium]|nr:insulinase family protein [Bacteroidales bacterium]